MKDWTRESWKADLPSLNNQALESVCKVLDPFNFMANNCNENIHWFRMSTSQAPDKNWIVRLSAQDGIACHLFPDRVRLSCKLFVRANNSQQLISAAKIMQEVRTIFKDMSAEEIGDKQVSRFCWQVEVEYNVLADVIAKIIDGLSSANKSFKRVTLV